MFSKTCQYAIRATVYVAKLSREGRRAGLRDIAAEIGSPEHFTAKIMQQLVRCNIVSSMKGPKGGFEIEKGRLHRIRLSQIVYSFDGDNLYKGCGLGLSRCSERQPCPVHDKFKIIREELRAMLENTTVYEMSMGLTEGLTFLRR
jgi:Rrf2 family transcriptional regulator, iron-sulfur cluster assembly transcription factor